MLEYFQWKTGEQAVEESKAEMIDELADIFIYCLQFADSLDVDLLEAANNKIKKNAVKYPVSEE